MFRSQAEGYHNLRTVTLRPMWKCLKDWGAIWQPAGASSFKCHPLTHCMFFDQSFAPTLWVVTTWRLRWSIFSRARTVLCRSTANDAACLQKQESWRLGERIECHSADTLPLVNLRWPKSRPDQTCFSLGESWLTTLCLNEEPLVSEEPDVRKQDVFKPSICV